MFGGDLNAYGLGHGTAKVPRLRNDSQRLCRLRTEKKQENVQKQSGEQSLSTSRCRNPLASQTSSMTSKHEQKRRLRGGQKALRVLTAKPLKTSISVWRLKQCLQTSTLAP